MSRSSSAVASILAALVLAPASCGIAVVSEVGTPPAGDGGSTTGGGSTLDAAPPPTPLPTPALRVVAGADNTCVLSAAGHVACWGSGETGQLGLGDTADHNTPVWLPGAGVTDVAVGDFAICSRHADGSVWCSGMNFYGELGAVTPGCPGEGKGCSAVPVQAAAVGPGPLVAGAHLFCVVQEADGSMKCWGEGPLWDGTSYHALSAASGYNATCVRFAPGPGDDPTRNVVCTGDNFVAEHGDGTSTSAGPSTVAVGVPGGFVEVATGLAFGCAVGASGELFCWGDNTGGALGVGISDTSDFPDHCPQYGACSKVPVRVTALPPVAHVAAHFGFVCAVTTGGEVYCWGMASHTSPASTGGCAPSNPECAPTPQLVPGVAHATSIAVGYGHACAVTAEDEVFCWGLNTHGQLGNGEGSTFETTPVKVVLPPEP